jgi:cytochrome c-type biogenesis protein CcmH/NrfF
LNASAAPTTRPKAMAINLHWLLVPAGVLVAGGAAFVGVTSRRRRKRTAATD